jgi:uncharacterized protein YfaP (DUF2135 family)
MSMLGFQQVTAAQLASAIALTLPVGTERAEIQAETANVRYRLDGTNPTAAIGAIVVAGAHQPRVITIEGGLKAAKFILESGSPLLNVHYFGRTANT